MNLSFVKDIFQKKNRSSILMLNVLASFFIKGWSALVVLIMVPLTLECLGKYKNGVWLTISSLLIWIDQMDIGLGNGLRNKLTSYMAHNNIEGARNIISSTFAMLVFIMFPILIILCSLSIYCDIYTFFNVGRYDAALFIRSNIFKRTAYRFAYRRNYTYYCGVNFLQY